MQRLHGDQINRAINTVAGTSYTFVLADARAYVRCTSSSAITLTIPAEADANFDLGARIPIRQADAGVPTIEGGVGVTLLSTNNALGGQHTNALLVKTGSDEWMLLGGVA